MNKDYEKLMHCLDKSTALGMACTLFDWDNATEAPKAAAELTAKYIGILNEAYYHALINDEIQSLIEKLDKAEDLNETQAAIVRKTKEKFDDIRLIPADEYAAYQTLTAKADSIWQKAKAENNFALFAPVLADIIRYRKKFASYKAEAKGYRGPLYDIALDDYEKGFTTEILDKFFDRLKQVIVPLVRAAVKNNHLIDKQFNFLSYDIKKQDEISRILAAHIGFDFERGVIKTSAHPFTTGLHNKDVRITTAYFENNLESAMFSTIHEGGHALYEMHIDDALTCTPVGEGASMGIHESQSRLFENNIGRSEAFWKPLFPMLKEAYPKQLKDITLSHFIEAINKSEPGLIRTEADELTYCLHIMVRYEMEKLIFSEDIDVSLLPKLWNDKYEEYLGIRPKTDSEGILQDIHWSMGSFGYFPSYAVGTAIAAQIYAHLKKVMPLDSYLSEGNFEPINAYLKEHLHKFGASKTTKELLTGFMGEDFNPEYYIRYLSEKYTKLYHLE